MEYYERLLNDAAKQVLHRAQLIEEPFGVAVAFLEHPHIFAQAKMLVEAGATLTWVYDPDPAKVAQFCELVPGAKVAASLEQILEDSNTRLVAAAGVPCERAAVGERVMRAGKDYFVDKCPFTTLEQAASLRQVCAETGRKYAVFYSERVQTEAGAMVDVLINAGVLGGIAHMAIQGPHKLGVTPRPDWFFNKAQTGGILTDIVSHQCDQFLHYGKASTGKVLYAATDNRFHPEHAGWEDFGDAVFQLDNGIRCYSRVDWLTPMGVRAFGDGRLFIVGEKASIEVRKYVDLARDAVGDRIFIADAEGEHELQVAGRFGFPYFAQLIDDCIAGSENAMTQAHAFRAGELAVEAQILADNS
ncbi:Gfo/Idh/MocA family protein [Coraliomargarita sp. W4R72]